MEAGKEQHLVKLVLHLVGLGTGKNLVANHLSVGIHGNVEKQTMRKRELGIVIFWSPVSG